MNRSGNPSVKYVIGGPGTERYTMREQAKACLFEYIEAFYNRVRRHSSLGFLSPGDFERSHNPNHP